MSFSKIDILNAQFSRSLMGYAVSEVDAVMSDVAEYLGQTAQENEALKDRVSQLENSVGEYQSRESALRDTLLATQKMMEELKVQAHKEAQLIIDEAHAKAEIAVQSGHARLAQVHKEVESMKRERTQFEAHLRSLLLSHLAILDAEDLDRVTVESLESKVTYLSKAD